MRQKYYEVNFDGIVGPTHNYSGLSYGNVASLKHQQATSNPKQAALQGLDKMHYLMQLGIKQAVLPPQERPHLPTLRLLGFQGSDAEIINTAFKYSPELFYACSSASNMWTANAATMTPSCDTADGKCHISPANLTNKFHRSIEHETTTNALKQIFPVPHLFIHHPVLPPGNAFSDEGAANHTRFCTTLSENGLHLFVYGRTALEKQLTAKLYPARQTLEASQAIARRHNVKHALFAQQNPDAIDKGVFHNDVISVGHQNLFLYHEKAFLDTSKVIHDIRKFLPELILIGANESEISLETAVDSYLFNSQIVTLPNNEFHLIAPQECHEIDSVRNFLKKIIEDKHNPINSVHYFNLHESMRNGGGPACLRMRFVLNEKELQAALPTAFLTEQLYQQLHDWINRHYRDRLHPQDLADPQLYVEGKQALDELTKILGFKRLYLFQQ